MKKAASKKTEIFEEEEVLQAVLICGESSYSLLPLEDNFPSCLLPLGGVTPLELTLSVLTRNGFQRVLLYIVAHAHRIRTFLQERGWLTDGAESKANAKVGQYGSRTNREGAIRVEVYELEAAKAIDYSKLSAVGDVMRDIYSRELLKSTRSSFLLISGDMVTNLNLREMLDTHKHVAANVDRNCVVSAFVRELPLSAAEYDADVVIITDERGKLLAFESRNVVDALDDDAATDEYSKSRPKGQEQRKVSDRLANEVQLRRSCVLNENSMSLRLRTNVTRTDIYCCANLVPSLFADNYDYVSMTDLVAGIIEHEETQQYASFTHVYSSGIAVRLGSARRSFGAALSVARLVRSGFAYPFTSSSNFLLPYANANATGAALKLKGSRVRESYVHELAQVDGGCLLVDSVVAERAQIGASSHLQLTVLLADSVVGQNCTIKQSIVGERVRIGNNTTVKPFCVLDTAVSIGENCTVPEGSRLTTDVRKLPYIVRDQVRLTSLMRKHFGETSNCYVFSGPLVEDAMKAAGSDLLGSEMADETFEQEKCRAVLRALLSRPWSAHKSNRPLAAAASRPPRSFGFKAHSGSGADDDQSELLGEITHYVSAFCDLSVPSIKDPLSKNTSPSSTPASLSSDEDEPERPIKPPPTPPPRGVGRQRTQSSETDEPKPTLPTLERSVSNSPLAKVFKENADYKACFDELVSTLDRAYSDNISNENLVVEINGLKHAYGLPIRDLRTLLSYAVLDCIVASPANRKRPRTDTGSSESQANAKSSWLLARTILDRWCPILVKYLGEAGDAQVTLLQAVAACTIEREPLCPHASIIGAQASELVHYLYEHDILEEDTIINWWKELPSDSDARKRLAPFVKWLEEAQEESDSDSS